VFTTPADFKIQAAGLFRAVGGSGGGGSVVTQTLAGLSDVAISGPTSGQALVYDSTAVKWENKSFISASISGNAATATSASFATNANSSSYALNAGNALTASFIPTSSLTGSFFAQGGNSFGAQALLGTNDAQNLAFETNGTVRMTISGSNGNVGIGTTTPSAALDVSGSTRVIGAIARNTVLQTNTDNHLVLTTTNTAGDVLTTFENSGDANNAWAIGRGNDGTFRINYSTGATYPSGTTTSRIFIDATGNVGIGTTAPSAALDISGSTVITGSLTVITGSNIEFQVLNTGVRIGNLITDIHTVTGSLSVSSSITSSGNIRVAGLTLGTGNDTATSNTVFGFEAFGRATSTLDRNTAIGWFALSGSTTGYSNIAVGATAMRNNTVGAENVAVGDGALFANVGGTFNTAIGNSALVGNTDGTFNTAIGSGAGGYITGGVTENTTADNSVYVGYAAYASQSNGQNEIVIGANNTGFGSNTVTLGNSSITRTILRGAVSASGGITGSLFGTASFATSASWAPSAGGGTSAKAGSGSAASFGGTPRTASITFGSAFSDNLYAVTVTGEDARTFTIQSKSSTGFTINSNSSVALTGPVYWIATAFN
jgi:hypothetical protein